MFYKFFCPEQNECFICCSVDGKSDTEKQFEMMYNQKYANYPLLTLSTAYNCKCQNSYAHNKCLLNINKCPTCRKVVVKPNLYVKTRYDYYLCFLLDWFKKDTSCIEKMKWCAIMYIIIMCLFLYSIIPVRMCKKVIYQQSLKICHLFCGINSNLKTSSQKNARLRLQ